MASFDPRNPQIISHGGIPQIVPPILETASVDFEAGEFVVFTSGKPTIVTASTKVNGIALVDSTNASPATAMVPVQLIGPDDEVLIRVASDASGTLALASTLTCGNDYAVDITSNLCYINSADTAGGQFVFVAPVLNAAGSSTYWGRFKPHSTLGFTAQIA